jgi:hypothetical protein
MSGTIQASVIKDSASATNNLTLDTGGNATVGNTLVMGSSFLRNRIINGDMRVNQRGYTSGAPLTTTGSYCVDRYQIASTTTGGFSSYQSSTAPTGFVNSLLYTKTTGTAPSAGDTNYIAQAIEGYNISDLAWGTANAKTITLSFWVYAGATGTFSGSLRNGAATLYSYPFTYTISSANTWTQITTTIAGPTVGTWATDNTAGLNVFFDLGSGSTYRGTAGAWAAGNYVGATGATTYPTSTTGGTFYLTGVQFEVGTVATPFERRQYGTEFALCQRYFNKLGGAATGDIVVGGYGSATGGIYTSLYYPVQMRAIPTTTTIVGTWTATNCGQPILLGAGSSSLSVYAIVTTLGGATVYTSGTSTYITNSAEL